MDRPTRTERDALGELQLPAGAYYGIQTARAVQNFPISGLTLPAPMVRAVARIKLAAAAVHEREGLLSAEQADAIRRAAAEIVAGNHDDQFVVDVFQAGAGTSFHMNVNEVVANRANELLGQPLGSYRPIHPNDQVNMGQSTNDVMPTAMRLATLEVLPGLLDVIERLADAFAERATAFADVIKAGRTHLQDAVPITLGQELGGYAAALRRGRVRLRRAAEDLHVIGLGGTAVGTGLNTQRGARGAIVGGLARLTGQPLVPAEDLFEAMQSLAPFADVSGALRTLALEVTRIANDMRLLASGPRTGLGELVLPAVQPGSSIMPGKLNPSVAEMVNQVCFQVLGHDATIAYAVQAGQLELNVMMPVVAHNLLAAIALLARALDVFTLRCVQGLAADAAHCRDHALRSAALATALNPLVGYQRAAEVVAQALAEDRAIPDIVIARGLMTADEAERAFSLAALTQPAEATEAPHAS